MCVLLVAYKSHPEYPLVMAANRDEYHARPTQPAGFWEDDPVVLAGRDLQAGGTWLGVTRSGRIGAVTNYHEKSPVDPALLSRGALVSDFLRREISPPSYAAVVADNGKWYGGFNIVFGTVDKLFYCSNRRSGCEPLGPGIHGLSNRFLNDRSFKIRKGKAVMEEILTQREHPSPDAFFTLLSDREQAPDDGGEDRPTSSLFIKGALYGTRSSTVIVMDRGKNIHFSERSYSPNGIATEIVSYDFQVKT